MCWVRHYVYNIALAYYERNVCLFSGPPGEKDLERGQDSMQTFEEILQLAQQHNVDCVLLGGDLFHDNRPSRRTMQECMRLLREC